MFLRCLTVVDCFACRSEKWVGLLDKAHGRLSRRDQEKVRPKMLFFHASKKNNNEAILRFMPGRVSHGTDLVDLLLTWNAWLDNDRMVELEKAVPVMSRAIQMATCAEMSAFLATAYARFWKRKSALVSKDQWAKITEDYNQEQNNNNAAVLRLKISRRR
jgi:hypothetical protein